MSGVVLDQRDGRLTVFAPGAPDPLTTTIRAVPGVAGMIATDSRTVRITGPAADVERVRDDVAAALRTIPGVTADRVEPPARPSLGLVVDRDAAARLGLPMSELAELLQIAVVGMVVTPLGPGDLRTLGAGTPVRLRLVGVDPDHLTDLVVPTSRGPISLSMVVSATRDEERDLLRVDGQRAVELAVRGGDEARWGEGIATVALPAGVVVARDLADRR